MGSWNLHKAIQGKEDHLDFFLMTSSLSGSVVSIHLTSMVILIYCAGS